MIDHLFGSPSPSWKRTQVFLVIFFWSWRILRGNPDGPRILWLRRANKALKRFTPLQLIVSTLTGVYTVRNLDRILGLGSPEPLANLYSPSYYRATWISTGLDAGFATAMTIRPKWLRDFCSVLFSVYYIIYANEADEKLRRFRAVPTVEMLRTTWAKTTNPYIRAFTYLPKVTIRRRILLPRPTDSTSTRPVTAWLFFASPEHHLARATDLILDIPGGGFIAMTPEHHEERLRMWAVRTGKPVLSIEYGKAPEYPYPYAIDECFDAYRLLFESSGRLIGMSGSKFNVILHGDSAGAHIVVGVMLKILETQFLVPHPLALVLNYAVLDFNFTSWMTPANLRVLQSEQSSGHIPDLAEQKDHFGHISPLSMVGDRKSVRRRRSWREAIRTLATPSAEHPPFHIRRSTSSLKTLKGTRQEYRGRNGDATYGDEAGDMADVEDDISHLSEEEKPLQARVRFDPEVNRVSPPRKENESPAIAEVLAQDASKEQAPLGTRLTMTSRTGYFQDRIISPSMMRAMAILYIGPHRNPDFNSDYHLSPILAPSHLLAQFPPLLMSCGEKDPFVDDTVIFAGRIREAKRARKHELDAMVSGKRAKLGEHLRMSAREGGQDEALRTLKRERGHLAAQSDEDWVQMQIFSEWSHGYLQMPMLMQEARTVIHDFADWMDDMFARKDSAPPRHSAAGLSEVSTTSSASVTETETDDVLTFSPKKRSPPPFSFADSGGRDESVSFVTNTSRPSLRPQSSPRVNEVIATSAGSRHPPSHRLDDRVQLDASQDSTGRLSYGYPPTPKTSASGKAGQTISESELMRRRRLLDSHLISTDSLK
ncbi:alpha/beta-hydrolase [Amylocystis lapponica]|nr:alpha/beta-hydrolase [Amylocystis lapponica]